MERVSTLVVLGGRATSGWSMVSLLHARQSAPWRELLVMAALLRWSWSCNSSVVVLQSRNLELESSEI